MLKRNCIKLVNQNKIVNLVKRFLFVLICKILIYYYDRYEECKFAM